MFPFILVTLLAMPVVAQRKADTTQKPLSWLDRRGLTKEWQEKEGTVAYKGSGRQYKARRGDKMIPKMVIDSIKFFDGVAVFTLNAQRGRGRTRLVPRSENDIHILSIFNVDVDSTVISRTLDTIRVYSGSAADDSRAEIKLMVQ
jgi:hypothetical protein